MASPRNSLETTMSSATSSFLMDPRQEENNYFDDDYDENDGHLGDNSSSSISGETKMAAAAEMTAAADQNNNNGSNNENYKLFPRTTPVPAAATAAAAVNAAPSSSSFSPPFTKPKNVLKNQNSISKRKRNNQNSSGISGNHENDTTTSDKNNIHESNNNNSNNISNDTFEKRSSLVVIDEKNPLDETSTINQQTNDPSTIVVTNNNNNNNNRSRIVAPIFVSSPNKNEKEKEKESSLSILSSTGNYKENGSAAAVRGRNNKRRAGGASFVGDLASEVPSVVLTSGDSTVIQFPMVLNNSNATSDSTSNNISNNNANTKVPPTTKSKNNNYNEERGGKGGVKDKNLHESTATAAATAREILRKREAAIRNKLGAVTSLRPRDRYAGNGGGTSPRTMAGRKMTPTKTIPATTSVTYAGYTIPPPPPKIRNNMASSSSDVPTTTRSASLTMNSFSSLQQQQQQQQHEILQPPELTRGATIATSTPSICESGSCHHEDDPFNINNDDNNNNNNGFYYNVDASQNQYLEDDLGRQVAIGIPLQKRPRREEPPTAPESLSSKSPTWNGRDNPYRKQPLKSPPPPPSHHQQQEQQQQQQQNHRSPLPFANDILSGTAHQQLKQSITSNAKKTSRISRTSTIPSAKRGGYNERLSAILASKSEQQQQQQLQQLHQQIQQKSSSPLSREERTTTMGGSTNVGHHQTPLLRRNVNDLITNRYLQKAAGTAAAVNLSITMRESLEIGDASGGLGRPVEQQQQQQQQQQNLIQSTSGSNGIEMMGNEQEEEEELEDQLSPEELILYQPGAIRIGGSENTTTGFDTYYSNDDNNNNDGYDNYNHNNENNNNNSDVNSDSLILQNHHIPSARSAYSSGTTRFSTDSGGSIHLIEAFHVPELAEAIAIPEEEIIITAHHQRSANTLNSSLRPSYYSDGSTSGQQQHQENRQNRHYSYGDNNDDQNHEQEKHRGKRRLFGQRKVNIIFLIICISIAIVLSIVFGLILSPLRNEQQPAGENDNGDDINSPIPETPIGGAEEEEEEETQTEPPIVINGPRQIQILYSSENESGFQDINTLEEKVLHYSALVNGLKMLDIPASIHLSGGDLTRSSPYYLAASEVEGLGFNGLGDIAMLNAMGLDAAGLGNHDIGSGLADFAIILANAKFPYLSINLDFRGAELPPGVPPIMVGPDASSCALMAGKVVKSCYIETSIGRIGLLGRSPSDLFDIIENPEKKLRGIDFFGGSDPVTRHPLVSSSSFVPEQIQALEEQGVNIIIFFDQDFADYNESGEPLLEEALEGIDIIIWEQFQQSLIIAQSDSFGPFNLLRPGDMADVSYPIVRRDNSGKRVLLVNSGGEYRYVGNLIVTFDANGVIQSWDGRSGPIATTQEAVTLLGEEIFGGEEEVVLEPLPAVVQTLKSLQNTPTIRDSFLVVGYTETVLQGEREEIRVRETNLGRLAADSMLWAGNLFTSENGLPPVDFALRNAGGIRASIIGPTISRMLIQTALSFNNHLSIVELNIGQLIAALENSVCFLPFQAGRLLHGAGIWLEVDTNMPCIGDSAYEEQPSRIKTVVIDGNKNRRMYNNNDNSDAMLNMTTDFEGDQQQQQQENQQIVLVENYKVQTSGMITNQTTFVVATNSFVAEGGDGFASFASGNLLGEAVDLVEQQILEDYIQIALQSVVDIPDPPPEPSRMVIF